MERQGNHPERSMETTLALFSVFSQISESITAGETVFTDRAETVLTHSEVFPESSCKGKISVTYLDNLVAYANVECSNGCTHQKEHVLMTDHTQRKMLKVPLSVSFEEVGYLSKEFEIDEETGTPELVSPISITSMQPKDMDEALKVHGIESEIKSGNVWIPIEMLIKEN